jgi:hypothetical protein
MEATEISFASRRNSSIAALLRGEAATVGPWLERWDARRTLLHLSLVVVGTALFGAAIGCWRSPMQALYTAGKLPLIVLLTTLGNALLNAMLAPLLGLNCNFRQSLLAMLMSFAIAGAILGSFSPVMAFLVWNAPAMSQASRESGIYPALLLALVAAIAFAGIAANLRLLELLRGLSGSQRVAWRVLTAWLAGNLLLGSQLSWILRPFLGSPHLPVQFLRTNAFQGNFFEATMNSFVQVLFN